MTKPELATAQSGYGGRGYRIPGRLDRYGKQKVYPSVTTVLKQVNKPGLMQWVADQTAAYAVANIHHLNDRSPEKAWGFLRFYWSREPDLTQPLRTHHEGVRDDAAELGTNIHEIIDADLQGTIPPMPDSPEAWEMVDVVEEWLSLHDVTMHHSEFTVVHDDLEYAGTADADWTIRCLHPDPCLGTERPVRCLIDLKTSRYTWPEHGMQLAALANAPVAMVKMLAAGPGTIKHGKGRTATYWVEREQPTYERAALLHIRPRDLTPRGDRIPAYCELVDVTKDLDLHQQGFEGALVLCQTAFALKRRAEASTLAGI